MEAPITSSMKTKQCLPESSCVDDDTRDINEETNQQLLCTFDGSVDRHGNPSIKAVSGGWGVASLVLINQALSSLAFFGVGVNLVTFMTEILRQDNVEAANNVSKWIGTSNIFSLVGAFLSDSYWGRHKTCLIFQSIFVSGLLLLSLSSYLLLLSPCIPGDGTPHCAPPTKIEIGIFYFAIYQIGLGNGGYQPCITTFGADQFDEEEPKESQSKMAFFSYFYVANNIGTLFSNTVLVYVEDKGMWVLGFWLSSGAAFLAFVIFLAGFRWYRHFNPCGNPLSRIAHVVIASLRNWNADVSTTADPNHLYEAADKITTSNEGYGCRRRICHTPDFRFLDKAAAIVGVKEYRSNDEDDEEEDNPPTTSPWRLCTVTQVEEVKCILRLLPIWLCTIMYSVVFTQMASIFIEQGGSMKTDLTSSFNIPPASVSIFEILSVTGVVVSYRYCIAPLLLKHKIGSSNGLTELQRMGVGLVLSGLGMVSAGVVESQRLKYAVKSTSSLSILWQIPPYVLMGASEVFMYVGQMEFFNRQSPDGLKSFGGALYVLSMALGNYVSSLIVTLVMLITERGGESVGWIPDNLNEGRLDYFFYLLAVLTAIDFILFVLCAKWYRCISFQGT